MTYAVKITDYAIGQMQAAMTYISKVLQEPAVARKWLAALKQEISGLSTMPLRFPLVEEEPWRISGVRKMPVGNFIVYYWPDEPAKIVWVTAVIYGRRDQLAALRNMPQ
ncbi:type II toxin-antitoxin system RelE/ParE family toxin [Oscillibacter valericigenes]|uniref:type II toxin-antitoxin system RelE/ParE family toxin n=1 Tax=Oscillibacter valericigenes TaxID=351091 RepID=UPI001F2ADEB1|nr:type II toxin-antitoxin system RelE/ParE family toxin [Oscillibacter valericigenes]MCF2663089.1 type II toxin-antitoxin system RelE/ParE family toxin [Oscillibacter valericigenes]